MHPIAFSELERSFVEEDNWFKSVRILERNPQLVDEAFARRLAEAAETSEDELERHMLDAMARFLARALEAGLETAAEEQLGQSGLLAGRAREARERFYETHDPEQLFEALDQFVLALLHDDDPLLFDHGMTLQGFGATLLDLTEAVDEPIFGHIGCLALLGSLTSLFTGTPLVTEGIWSDRLERASSGARMHAERLEARGVDGPARELYAAVRLACMEIEQAVASTPGRYDLLAQASFSAVCLALASTRIEIPPPSGDMALEPEFRQVVEAWLAVVLQWIERYGSDMLRLRLAVPPNEEPDDSASVDAPSQLPPPPVAEIGEELLAWPPAISSPMGVLPLLLAAVLSCAADRAQSRALVENARRLLKPGQVPATSEPRSELDMLLGASETLAALTNAVAAYVELEDTELQRFHGVRNALSTTPLALLVELLEPAARDAIERFNDPPQQEAVFVVAATLVLRDLLSLLRASEHDLGLREGERYAALLERLNAVTGMESVLGGFSVDPETPGLGEMQELLVQFENSPGSLTREEGDRVCDWLGDAYEAGRVYFPTTANELATLINLGWLGLNGLRPDTFTWLDRARRLALESDAPMDAATADLNAAAGYLTLVTGGSLPWTLDVEQLPARVAMISAGLSHALEALRITTVAAELADPHDRYHVGNIGYAGARVLLERLLFEAADAALLTEYLLNARGMWFLLDFHQMAGAGGVERGVERPVVSWRGRSWVAQSLPVDGALELSALGTAAAIDVADVLAPGGEPQAFWFGSIVDEGRLAASFVVPPREFFVMFAQDEETVRGLAGLPCAEAAAALGRLLPAAVWAIADALVEVDERMTLFVSLDPGLPPISMGLWRRDGEGAARMLADAFDVVYCPSLAPRPGATSWTTERRAAAPAAFVVCDPLGDLPAARVVPRLAREVRGNGAGGVRRPANRETVLALLDACAQADGVFVYQGHSESGALEEPGAASLLLEPLGPSDRVFERLGMLDVLHSAFGSMTGRMPRRAAFLSCGSGVASARYDATGIAMAALAGGSDAVVSTLRPVADAAPWTAIVDELVDVLCAADPWNAFGAWQRVQAAAVLDEPNAEPVRWAVASLAVFGAPFVGAVRVGAAP